MKGFNSGFIVAELALITGVDFGYDRQQWENWWSDVRDRWQIPARFRLPWDEQQKRG